MKIRHSWITKVAAVLQLLYLILQAEAENIAERSFFSSNHNAGNHYPVQSEMTEENGVKRLEEFHPFHEVYSVKGKDGAIERIHYATDDKGVRANFYSNAINAPFRFVPFMAQSPFKLLHTANNENPSTFVVDDSTLVQNMLPLKYESANIKKDAHPGILEWAIPVNSFVSPSKNQKSNLENALTLQQTPLSQSSAVLEQSAHAAAVNTRVPFTLHTKDEVYSVTDHTNNKRLKNKVPILTSKNKKMFDNALKKSEINYPDIVTDLQRIVKVQKPASKTIYTEKKLQNSHLKLLKGSTIYNPPSEISVPSFPASNQSIISSGLTKINESKIVANNSRQNQTSFTYVPVVRTSLSADKGKLEPSSVVEASKRQDLSSNAEKILTDLKKIYEDSVISAPVSTVFDISNNNGRYYHYILNMVQPTDKKREKTGKYFATGNALLKLLDEAEIPYKTEDIAFSKVENTKVENENDNKIGIDSDNRSGRDSINSKENSLAEDTTKSIENSNAYTHTLSNDFSKKSKDDMITSEKLKSTTLDGRITTMLISETSLSTTTEMPSTDILSTLPTIHEKKKEIQFTDAIEPTSASIIKNITDVDMDSLFVTMTKAPLNMLLVPVNWLFPSTSEGNLTANETENSSTVFNEKTIGSTSTVEIVQSTTSVPKTTLFEMKNSETNNMFSDNDMTTVEVASTTLPPVTTATSSSLGDQISSTTTTAPPSENLQQETTTVSFLQLEHDDNATDSNTENASILVEQDKYNETNKILYENSTSKPNETSHLEATANTITDPKTPVAGQNLNTTHAMIILQVSDMNGFMSNINNLPSELTSIIEKQSLKKESKQRKMNLQKDSVTTKDFSLSENTTYNDSKAQESMVSQVSTGKTFKVKNSKVERNSDLINDRITGIEYSLIHPILFENGDNIIFQLPQSEIRSILGIPEALVQNKHIGTAESVLRTKSYNIIPSFEGRNQQKSSVIRTKNMAEARRKKENNAATDNSESNRNKPMENFSLVNDMISHYPHQNNLQHVEATQFGIPIRDVESIDSQEFRPAKQISMQKARQPEESQIADEINIEKDSFNESESLQDFFYDNSFIDIPRLNDSNAHLGLIPEIEIIEYVPIDSVRSNIPSSQVSDANKFHAEDPVYILEEYASIPSSLQQNTVNNPVEEISGSYNYAPFSDPREGDLLILNDIPFGVRLQEVIENDNFENPQFSVVRRPIIQSHMIPERDATLDRAPWTK